MADMPRTRRPHLYNEPHKGSTRWYVRKGHGKRIRIRAEYGTEAFDKEYAAALAGAPMQRKSPKAQTLEWGLARYRSESQDWRGLALGTRKSREAIFRAVIRTAGAEPLSEITQEDILDGMQRRESVPHAANNFLKAMRGFYKWACDPKVRVCRTDPTAGAKKLKGNNPDGFHTWTEDEARQFEARWPVGTRERLAFVLLAYTGLRRGDMVRLGRQHIVGDKIVIRTEKSQSKIKVTLKLAKEVREVLDATATGDMTFLTSSHGTPYTKESFGNWFAGACIEAGVPGRAHGIRKLGAVRAVENGASEKVLCAIFGWKDGKMAAHYTAQADREKLASQSDIWLAPRQTENEEIPHESPREGLEPKTVGKSGA